jgi:hypothetical protein
MRGPPARGRYSRDVRGDVRDFRSAAASSPSLDLGCDIFWRIHGSTLENVNAIARVTGLQAVDACGSGSGTRRRDRGS